MYLKIVYYLAKEKIEHVLASSETVHMYWFLIVHGIFHFEGQ